MKKTLGTALMNEMLMLARQTDWQSVGSEHITEIHSIWGLFGLRKRQRVGFHVG